MQVLYTGGIRHLVAGTQIPSVTYQQLTSALAVGMTVDIYVQLSTKSDLDHEMAKALYASEGVPIESTWIVFEAPPPDGGSAERWIQAALEAAERVGLPQVGVYTGAWWWDAWVADSAPFARYALWYAFYNGLPVVNWPRERFGAWITPAWKQYVGSTSPVGGMNLDLNVKAC